MPKAQDAASINIGEACKSQDIVEQTCQLQRAAKPSDSLPWHHLALRRLTLQGESPLLILETCIQNPQNDAKGQRSL